MKSIKLFMIALSIFSAGSLFLGAGKASAAGWTNLSLQEAAKKHYSSARACKTATTGGYGPVWKYTYHVFRKDGVQLNTYTRTIQAQILRNPTLSTGYYLSPVTNDKWLFGAVAGLNVYGSRLFDDRVQFSAGGLLIGNALYSPYQIANC